MKKDYIHITFVIDKSGSMSVSKKDVISGFEKIISEQKENKEGKCSVSMYTFNEKVTEDFVGVDVNDLPTFNYNPYGMTALNDGCGIAIYKTGKWLSDMDESERPSKVLVAVFTDGLENSSKEYTLSQIKDMIKHQEDVYNWTFIYMGTDITTSKMADDLGFKNKTYGSRRSFCENYNIISKAASHYRAIANTGASGIAVNDSFETVLKEEADKNTSNFETFLGSKISNE